MGVNVDDVSTDGLILYGLSTALITSVTVWF